MYSNFLSILNQTTTSTSSSSSAKMNTTSSSTTKVSSEKTVSQQSTGGQQSSVVISEVNTNIGSLDDGTLRGMQTQYVVTQPEHVVTQTQKPKEHFIFGGTQIVEVGTTLGSAHAREKNQSTWDGKFVYEGAPQRTVLKSWTKQETSSEPGTSTVTTTSEEIFHSGGGPSTTKRDVATESSKLVSDTMKKQQTVNQPQSGKMTVDSRYGTDSTDNANKTDLLLESERCIAKKAYVTTDRDDEKVTSGSTTSNIESQILSNKSLFDTKETSDKTTKTTTGSHSDSKPNDRYPVTTVPSRSGNVQNSTITSSGLVKASDNSNRQSTEQYSQSFSTSSRTEKASSSNQVIEIVDGKEKVVSDTFKESGSMQSKSSQERYNAKFGSGMTPEVVYDHKLAEENIQFANDKRDKEPIFDRNYRDSYRHVQQTGDKAPVEHLKGSYETTRFDDKTKKYVTDVQHHENNRPLEPSTRITDSIQSKYDVGTSRLNIDSHTGTNNQLTHATDSHSQFDSMRNDRLNTSTTTTSTSQFDNISSSTSNDFIRTAKNDSFDAKSTAYTSKVFDNKTNTWKVVDESNINEINKRSTTHKPSDIDHRQSPTRYTDLKHITTDARKYSTDATKLSSDTHVTTDKKSINDRRTSRDKSTTIDRTTGQRANTSTSTTTKTSDKKVQQHLYDEKTKTWREVDEKTIKSKRPSLIRYVSKDNEGKFTTIYKRKLFDKRSGAWKVVDEKVYKNNNFNEHIPEVIEDVTNCTTTTYTTKVYDTKTNTWRVVDEQTFTDRNTNVPKDIADELARDQPDIANITTTTELTKVS